MHLHECESTTLSLVDCLSNIHTHIHIHKMYLLEMPYALWQFALGSPFTLTSILTHTHILTFTHSRTHACRFALVILPFWCSSRQFDFLLFLFFQANRKSLSAFVAAGCCCLCCLFFLRALCFPIRLLTIKSKIASGISFSQTLKENQAQISAAQP